MHLGKVASGSVRSRSEGRRGKELGGSSMPCSRWEDPTLLVGIVVHTRDSSFHVDFQVYDDYQDKQDDARLRYLLNKKFDSVVWSKNFCCYHRRPARGSILDNQEAADARLSLEYPRHLTALVVYASQVFSSTLRLRIRRTYHVGRRIF